MPEQTARILIVDDEFSVRDSLENWFLKDGYEVRAVANGQEALQAVEEQLYELAVVDLKMPGMDGLELLGHLIPE